MFICYSSRHCHLLLLLLFFNIIILIYLNKLIVKSFPLDRAISIRYINKRLHAFACYKRGRGDRPKEKRERVDTPHIYTLSSSEEWDRAGFGTGLGGGELARETTRDDDWHGPDKQTGTGIARVARSHPRWPTVTHGPPTTDALVPWITTDVDRRSIALGDIVRISILETSAPQRARSFLINVNDWQLILAFDLLETKKKNSGICQFCEHRAPAAIACLGVYQRSSERVFGRNSWNKDTRVKWLLFFILCCYKFR